MKSIKNAILLLIIILFISSCTAYWTVEGDYDTYPGQSLEGFALRIDFKFGDPVEELYSTTLDKEGLFSVKIPKYEGREIMFLPPISHYGVYQPWMNGRLEFEPNLSNNSDLYKLDMDEDIINIGKAYIFNHIKVEYTGPKVVTSLDQISAKWDNTIPNIDKYTFWISNFQGTVGGVAIYNIKDRFITGETIVNATILEPPILPNIILPIEPYIFRKPILIATKYLIGVGAYYYDELKDNFVSVGSSITDIGPYDFVYEPIE